MTSDHKRHMQTGLARRNQRHRGRGLVAAAVGLLSALGGLSMTLPSAWSIYLLSRPGVLINEQPWLPIGTGLAAVMLARGCKWRIGGWLGICGVLMGLRPLWHLQSVSRRHDAAMADGLGQNFQAKIQRELLNHATRARLDIAGTSQRRRTAARIIKVENNIAFYSDDRSTLYLDVYQPLDSFESRRPAIIAIHGGGWNGGDKGSYHIAKQRWLAQQGYVVFDIQYRLSPAYLWPIHLTDVKTAIRWVRAHADQYQIDPDRIGLIGRSAGGHLALMAAFTPGEPAFAPSDGLPARDDVQAVVALYPPTDLVLLQETAVEPLSYWLGDTLTCNPNLYHTASPLHAAGPNAPPVLLAHGGCDNLVTPAHSERMFRRLRELGVPSVYLYYPWGRHGFDVSLSGLGGHMVQYDTERFLAVTLRKDER